MRCSPAAGSAWFEAAGEARPLCASARRAGRAARSLWSLLPLGRRAGEARASCCRVIVAPRGDDPRYPGAGRRDRRGWRSPPRRADGRSRSRASASALPAGDRARGRGRQGLGRLPRQARVSARGELSARRHVPHLQAEGRRLRRRALRRRRRRQRRFSQVRRWAAHDARLLARLRRRARGAPRGRRRLRRLGRVYRQKAAQLTCFVPSITERGHVHFVDGAGGGYTMAAKAMKARPAAEGGQGGLTTAGLTRRARGYRLRRVLRLAPRFASLTAWTLASDSPERRERRLAPDADDGAIFRDQGGQSRLPALLPDGRFLRVVLRRRRGREPGARHRADQARQARGRRHPHVRRAGRARRRLSQPADRARPSRRGLRAARGSGGGEEAGREVGGASARSCGWSRRARLPRSGCSSRAARACWSRCRRFARARRRWTYGLAALDLSTGAFTLSEADEAGLAAEIARLEPSEIVASQAVYRRAEFSADRRRPCGAPATAARARGGDGAAAERRVCEFYGVETLDGFGAFTRAEIAAAALALAYVKRTQFEARPALSAPTRRARGASLEIDPATRANLELTRTLKRRARGLAAGDDRSHRDARRGAPARRAARQSR